MRFPLLTLVSETLLSPFSLLFTPLLTLRKQSNLFPYFIYFFSPGPSAQHILNERENL